MKEKLKIIFALCSLSVLISGCEEGLILTKYTLPLNEAKISLIIDLNSSKNLAVQSIDNTRIDRVDVDITGINVTLISVNNVTITNGIGSVSAISVPAGKNRIVQVTGKNNLTGPVSGAELQAVFSVVNGDSKTIPVSWQTTPAAKVIDHLINDGNGTNNDAVWESYAYDMDITNLQSFITYLGGTSGHYALINAEAVADYIKNNNGVIPPTTNASAYILGVASITGKVYGLLSGDSITLTLNDPYSTPVSVFYNNQGASYTLNNVIPNSTYSSIPTWQYDVKWANKPTGWTADYVLPTAITFNYLSEGTTTDTDVNASWASVSINSIGVPNSAPTGKVNIAVPGETLSIIGNNFHPTLTNNIIRFNNLTPTIPLEVSNSTTLKVVIPTGVANGEVKIQVGDTQSNGMALKTLSSVSTLAGTGTPGYADGSGSSARFNRIAKGVFDSTGNYFVADTDNHVIRKISATGDVTTFAGLANILGSTDGTGSAARFNAPVGLTIDSSNNIFVADSGNNRLRKITNAGVVTTIAGEGTAGYLDGTGDIAKFKNPKGIAVDSNGTVLFVSDTSNNCIRQIVIGLTPALTTVSTIAGGTIGGYSNGTGDVALFNSPIGLFLDGGGTLYLADSDNHVIRKIVKIGYGNDWTNYTVSTLAGNAPPNSISGYMDGVATGAQFYSPSDVTMDFNNNIYVADKMNNRIRKINTSTSYVYTVAGGAAGFVDNTNSSSARFYYPAFVTFDSSGNLYISDDINYRIRKIM